MAFSSSNPDDQAEFEQRLSLAGSIDEVLRLVGAQMPPSSEIIRKIGASSPVRMEDYLEKAGLPSSDYSLHLFDGFLASGIFCDAPYKLSLVRKGLERWLDVAAIGFEAEFLEFFNILQIQGRDNKFGGLPFDVKKTLPPQWERKLAKAAMYLAADLGFREVTIPKADQLACYDEPCGIDRWDTEAMAEHKARMKMRYDVTARRIRMSFDPQRRVYYMDLQLLKGVP